MYCIFAIVRGIKSRVKKLCVCGRDVLKIVAYTRGITPRVKKFCVCVRAVLKIAAYLENSASTVVLRVCGHL